jgi:glyoxylase-like metal-dependent hydrolase (beta-lactamase superfamily II)/rhodanese-related sulfurtransferase
MQLQQYYLACLAHASYLLSDGGEAAVIDPRRDVDIYIDDAAKLGVRIRYVIETHLHADFVSGHRELAARTGAQIVLGHRAGAKFPHKAVHENDVLKLGSASLLTLETPGHTIESISIVIADPPAVFTGDTLFIGDVGRPDLDAHHTPKELAAMLYHSLHNKLLLLRDDVAVYPAHGAGSLCGRAISNERSSTIGEQKRTNYACRPMTQDEFIRVVTADLPERPAYFARDVEINRAGAPALSEMKPLPALSPILAASRIRNGAVVIDTRPGHQFAAGHIPGSINIGLNGQFAAWAGSLLPADREVILVCEEIGKVEESRMRLARVGIDKVVGYVAQGLLGWQSEDQPVAQLSQITAGGLLERLGEYTIVDVRNDSEVAQGAIRGSLHIPLGALNHRLDRIPTSKPVLVTCKSGYRAMAAASLLLANGFSDVINLIGGYDAWVATPSSQSTKASSAS